MFDFSTFFQLSIIHSQCESKEKIRQSFTIESWFLQKKLLISLPFNHSFSLYRMELFEIKDIFMNNLQNLSENNQYRRNNMLGISD